MIQPHFKGQYKNVSFWNVNQDIKKIKKLRGKLKIR